MWFDTHCHLDAAEFDADRDEVVARARASGVDGMLVPAVDAAGFARVAACAHRYECAYTLGIHPLYVGQADEGDLDRLREAVRAAMPDPRFVGIGEIGLDHFDPAADRARQRRFLEAQLRLAREMQLPVVLHLRRCADELLAALRRAGVASGIAHAFNGSEQQAQAYVDHGLRLGFGGAATYAGSLRIRRLGAWLPASAIVVETDAPDIPPQWLRIGSAPPRNEPAQLPRIAQELAQLRGMRAEELAAICRANAMDALPRLAALFGGGCAPPSPPAAGPVLASRG